MLAPPVAVALAYSYYSPCGEREAKGCLDIVAKVYSPLAFVIH